MRPFIFLIVLAVLAACGNSAEPSSTDLPVSTTVNTEKTTPAPSDKQGTQGSTAIPVEENTADTPTPEYISVPKFTIKLTPTKQVQDLVSSGKESFVLLVKFYEQATDPKAVKGKEYYVESDELIYLLEKEYPMTGTLTEIVLEERILKEAFDHLAKKDYLVTISGISGRLSSTDNLFYTESLSGTISKFAGTTKELSIEYLE